MTQDELAVIEAARKHQRAHPECMCDVCRAVSVLCWNQGVDKWLPTPEEVKLFRTPGNMGAGIGKYRRRTGLGLMEAKRALESAK